MSSDAPLSALSSFCVALLAVVAMAASPTLASAQTLTPAAAREAAKAVKLLPEDLPGYEAATFESGVDGALGAPLRACAGRATAPPPLAARTTSAFAVGQMDRVVATAVSVLPSAAVAHDDVAALARARFRRCIARSARKEVTTAAAKEGFHVRLTIRPLWVRGPDAVGLRIRFGFAKRRVHLIQTTDSRWFARGPMAVLLMSNSTSATMPNAEAHAIMDRLRERVDAALGSTA